MVAQKRSRSKPLIRPAATTPVINGTMAVVNGAVRRRQNHGFIQAHLQQLSALHMSGVLTDEEFSAAKQRLLGL